jgi:uncharacterized Zn finger protein
VIDGNFGVYRTQVSLRRRTECSCSCPSEDFPCKHVAALLETYKLRPQSFFDFDSVMKNLESKEKSELLLLIREMVLASPPSLTALGVDGFEPSDDEEEGYEGDS